MVETDCRHSVGEDKLVTHTFLRSQKMSIVPSDWHRRSACRTTSMTR